MEWHLENNLLASFLVAVRIGALMAFVPFLGSRAVPARVKAGLLAALTLLLAPVYAPQGASFESIHWGRFLLGELTAGLLLGLSLLAVFEGVRIAGQLLGFQAGFSLARLFDPQSNADAPVLSVFFQTLAILVFLQLDVHLWVLRGLAKSFEYIPLGTAIPTEAVAAKAIQVTAGMWLAGVQMAGPALLATMLADVVMGFMSKASPQLPVLLMGISVKALIVFLVLGGVVAFWPGVLEGQFARAIGFTEELLGLAR